ncbi:hypothetical protein CONLIGDRAFT_569207 [Coniochaeta ligniaria NRRL 30616]|uniref:Uncharacterized protein n=1 Tax=Coniochaeta ligniaria NRRL 30616 TaxID=1408157 RepID=A0A1J7J2J0_9PEZI|nr:hypothetical protein CONLIGDRAFT_569207 [Coniochaeta ligniaria NRRL 30616]
MDRKRTVHQLDTPYSTVQWPQVSHEDQETILELLCSPWLTNSSSLLSPLGHHRRSFISPSKGKRAKRRKRKGAETDTAVDAVPPAPELAKHVDLGLASISRSLERIPAEISDESPLEPYAVVFVARSGQPSAFHSHFPQMVAVASKSVPGRQPIRLVGFSAACEERLSSSLGIPRVSSIGLREGAPQTKALVEFVREHVPPVDMSWFQEVKGGQFIETKINAVEVPVGTKKQKIC